MADDLVMTTYRPVSTFVPDSTTRPWMRGFGAYGMLLSMGADVHDVAVFGLAPHGPAPLRTIDEVASLIVRDIRDMALWMDAMRKTFPSVNDHALGERLAAAAIMEAA